MRRKTAFTLIELLIVVAIIAILAAIAVPNFLEAQARAKVSRAKADMRSIATAVEAYAVDYSRYPIPVDAFGAIIPSVDWPATEWFETKVPQSLTTPIAYITTRFEDPYHPKDKVTEDPTYHFMTREFTRLSTGSDAEFGAYAGLLGIPTRAAQWSLLSHGPDLDHDSPDLAENPAGARAYDPTNGTVSNGDVLLFGPGAGFARQ